MGEPLKVLVVEQLPNTSEIHLNKIYWVKGSYCKRCGTKILSFLTTTGPYYGDNHGGYKWKDKDHDCIQFLNQRITKLEEQINARTTN